MDLAVHAISKLEPFNSYYCFAYWHGALEGRVYVVYEKRRSLPVLVFSRSQCQWFLNANRADTEQLARIMRDVARTRVGSTYVDATTLKAIIAVGRYK